MFPGAYPRGADLGIVLMKWDAANASGFLRMGWVTCESVTFRSLGTTAVGPFFSNCRVRVAQARKRTPLTTGAIWATRSDRPTGATPETRQGSPERTRNKAGSSLLARSTIKKKRPFWLHVLHVSTNVAIIGHANRIWPLQAMRQSKCLGWLRLAEPRK